MFVTARWASGSILPSVITRYRRISIICPTCSFITGQASSQFRQVVQPASSSSVITSPIILIGSIAETASVLSILEYCFAPLSPKAGAGTHAVTPLTAAPLSVKWSRSLIIISIGDNILPDVAAGHTSVQRPHSTQAEERRVGKEWRSRRSP